MLDECRRGMAASGKGAIGGNPRESSDGGDVAEAANGWSVEQISLRPGDPGETSGEWDRSAGGGSSPPTKTRRSVSAEVLRGRLGMSASELLLFDRLPIGESERI